MNGTLWVDPEQLDRMSREFRAAAHALQAHADRFAARCGDPRDAYGTLPESADAAGHYAGAVDSMSAYVARRIAGHHAHADALADAAARYRSARGAALDAVRRDAAAAYSAHWA